jgi:hypothetical protein
MRALIFTVLLLSAAVGMAQESHHHSSACEGLIGIYHNVPSFVPPPKGLLNSERTSVFVVNYTGFTPEAQAAFKYATDIWASILESDVPIVIDANYQSIQGGTLGFAQAFNLLQNFPGAPLPNTLYPCGLANKLAGYDIQPANSDIIVTLNQNINWYFGTDGLCPANHYDFVTVALHEIGHGLGISGSAVVSSGVGNWQLPIRVIYDLKVQNGSGQAITSFTPGTAEMAAQLTSNNLFWGGEFATATNNDVNPQVHAPATWSSGSSFSHLNEASYLVGSINSLLTPFIFQSEAIHFPGPIAIAMLKDIGWSLKQESFCSGEHWTLTIQTDCKPKQIHWRLLDDAGNPLLTIGAHTYHGQGSYDVPLCIQPGQCYTLEFNDSGADGLASEGCADEGTFFLTNAEGDIVYVLETADFGSSILVEICGEQVAGCADSSAINFNPEATVDDGSCLYDCELPTIDFEVICGDENSTEFLLQIVSGDLGVAAPYELSLAPTGGNLIITNPIDQSFGPFSVGTDLTLTLTSLVYESCQNQVFIPGICPVGLEEQNGSYGMLIWPNPAGDRLFVRSSEKMTYGLINLMGQVIQTGELEVGINEWNLSDLPLGTYLVESYGKSGITRSKVVRQ